MKCIALKPKESRRYLSFIRRLDRTDPLRRNILHGNVKALLKREGALANSCLVLEPTLVVDGEEILAACIYLLVDRMPGTLQLAFFEVLPDQRGAVDLLIERGKEIARERGAEKLLFGLNGHVNYGLGFLAEHFHEVPIFGSQYNPRHVVEMLEHRGATITELMTYYTAMDRFEVPISDRLKARIRSRYRVVEADLGDLEATAAIYTKINNAAFADHAFYYPRRVTEDLELFREFKPFLRPENLLLLYAGDKPIGFMLWYPDFNQLIRSGERIGLRTWLRWKWREKTIDTFKIVEIGILPTYQGKGGIVALFEACRERVRGRFAHCEAGWILEENQASRGFGLKWADAEHHRFRAYELPVESQ